MNKITNKMNDIFKASEKQRFESKQLSLKCLDMLDDVQRDLKNNRCAAAKKIPDW